MKLSDAILLGAMIRPKANGFFFKDGASCAQGAALEATGTPYNECVFLGDWYHTQMRHRWPWIHDRCTTCPECGMGAPLAVLIPHLNNYAGIFGGHNWTREQIAAFVATVEPADAPDAVDPSGASNTGTRSTREPQSSSASSSVVGVKVEG